MNIGKNIGVKLILNMDKSIEAVIVMAIGGILFISGYVWAQGMRDYTYYKTALTMSIIGLVIFFAPIFMYI